jgi:AAA family ATP:ADP antiporter
MLVLVATALLELAVQCALALARRFRLGFRAGGPREPGPGPMEGFRLLWGSRYLQLIGAYILLFTLTTTFLYLAQGAIVAKAYAGQADRTAAFARIDFWANLLTLGTQLFLTGRLIRAFGLRTMLLILPLLSLAGFGALWIWPTFAVLALFQVLRRGLHYAVDRPVREVLYIPLSADEKYKSKPFIDTFVYRGGDFLGAWAPTVLGWILIPAAGAALGITALWCGVSSRLGNHQRGVFGEGAE